MNFIAGSGGEIGNALVNAKPLKAISFTGSCEIGNRLHAEASKRRLRIQLEMGGKNPTIVLNDADFNTAVENTVNAAFFSTGQKCTATSRVIVEEGIYNKFIDAMVERTRKLKIGNGMEPGIDIGPAVDEGQLKTNLNTWKSARKKAANPRSAEIASKAVCTTRVTLWSRQSLPMSIPEMTLAQEEVFGPNITGYRPKIWSTRWRSRTTFRLGCPLPFKPPTSRVPSISSTKWKPVF